MKAHAMFILICILLLNACTKMPVGTGDSASEQADIEKTIHYDNYSINGEYPEELQDEVKEIEAMAEQDGLTLEDFDSLMAVKVVEGSQVIEYSLCLVAQVHGVPDSDGVNSKEVAPAYYLVAPDGQTYYVMGNRLEQDAQGNAFLTYRLLDEQDWQQLKNPDTITDENPFISGQLLVAISFKDGVSMDKARELRKQMTAGDLSPEAMMGENALGVSFFQPGNENSRIDQPIDVTGQITPSPEPRNKAIMFLTDLFKPKVVLAAPLELSATATAPIVEPTPTIEPTPTAEPIPTLSPELTGGIEGIPDPKISNPELFDLTKENAPIPQFVNAMKMAGIEVTGEQVAQRIKIQVLKDKDKNIFAIYNYDGFPLIIANKEEGSMNWGEITIKAIGERAGLPFGTVFGHTEESRMKPTYSKEFNVGVIDYDFQWRNIETKQGNLKFTNSSNYVRADEYLKFAASNGMEIRGQSLLFSQFYPDWLRKGNFTKEQLLQIVKDHINDVVTYGKNKGVKLWSVVNEYHPLSWHGVNSDRYDLLQAKIGRNELLFIAYKTAREVDSNALLLYNDNGNEKYGGPGFENTMNVIRMLTKDPNNNLIDGVGLQLHIDGSNPPSKEGLIQTMKTYGLPIYITELDVNIKNLKGGDRLKTQAQIYQDVISACLESGVCKSIVVFNIGDKYSWLEESGSEAWGGSKNADPTLFDDNFNRKPSYYYAVKAMLDFLQSSQ